VQTYDQHLGPVNTITFVDDNRRFVSTSDDKTIRGWDYDIPVVIKYIAEPYMHSMPAVTLHPSSKSTFAKLYTDIRQILRLSIVRQSDSGILRRREFQAEQEKTIRRSHDCWLCVSDWVFTGREIHIVW